MGNYILTTDDKNEKNIYNDKLKQQQKNSFIKKRTDKSLSIMK